ncbi:heavy-metal-associated domain-containing protein [Massilia pseudoviolaceinigra]|uniref:heavy-metal-associated domain-containing protein n=1 Tax=Massilia pseudoviolaceinigra TaxID=3057165 RepID=UPI002796CFF9|nr:heavy-metal-associated domain-containing protein [Massilia sp. CCM 9206]MDQ1923979.1 heavy-metal-associated domain-containing protein [Massilia sp. CCM 9206]
MIKLSIPDMSCGHCAGVITKTVKELDQDAVIAFDMPARTVELNTTAAQERVVASLADAGYPATVAR